MTLQTNDVGVLFATMQANYGHKWPHRSDAVPVWQAKLKHLTLPKLMIGADRAFSQFQDFPPTLGQFVSLCGDQARATTYLPPPRTDAKLALANRKLMGVVMLNEGVDSQQMKNLVSLKNALMDEPEWPDIDDQLRVLAANCDKEKRAAEREQSREAFCVRQGLRYRPLEELAKQTWGKQ